jgi:hypothetical protein
LAGEIFANWSQKQAALSNDPNNTNHKHTIAHREVWLSNVYGEIDEYESVMVHKGMDKGQSHDSLEDLDQQLENSCNILKMIYKGKSKKTTEFVVWKCFDVGKLYKGGSSKYDRVNVFAKDNDFLDYMGVKKDLVVKGKAWMKDINTVRVQMRTVTVDFYRKNRKSDDDKFDIRKADFNVPVKAAQEAEGVLGNLADWGNDRSKETPEVSPMKGPSTRAILHDLHGASGKMHFVDSNNSGGFCTCLTKIQSQHKDLEQRGQKRHLAMCDHLEQTYRREEDPKDRRIQKLIYSGTKGGSPDDSVQTLEATSGQILKSNQDEKTARQQRQLIGCELQEQSIGLMNLSPNIIVQNAHEFNRTASDIRSQPGPIKTPKINFNRAESIQELQDNSSKSNDSMFARNLNANL